MSEPASRRTEPPSPPAPSWACVVLAAGAGRRFDSPLPKALAPFRGEALVHRAARVALEAGLTPVVVVTGHQGERIAGALTDLAVIVAENAAWAEGQSTSVLRGLDTVRERAPAAAGVLFCPCDQPRITAAALGSLLAAARRHRQAAVLACHQGRPRAPSLFPRQAFEALGSITGDRGGRQILPRQGIEAIPGAVVHVEFADPDLLRDVDSLDDLKNLEAGGNK